MPSDQAPQAARLTSEQILQIHIQWRHGEYTEDWDTHLADAATEQAYRVCRQEALDAAAGLVAFIKEHALKDSAYILEDWNKFKEAGSGDTTH